MLKNSILIIIVISGVTSTALFFVRTDENPLRDNSQSTHYLSETNAKSIDSSLEKTPAEPTAKSSDTTQDLHPIPPKKIEEYLKTIDISMSEGFDLSQEKFINIMNDLLRLEGLSPLERPYWARLKEIHNMVEERGYKREELFDFYRPILDQMGENIIKDLQQAKKTHELAKLFKNNKRMELEQWMQERFEQNTYDIPALLVQIELLYSPYTVDVFFDAIKNFVIGLENFESNGVDKRALLYRVLDMGMIWGSMTADHLELAKEKSIQTHLESMSPGLAEFLCRLEITGDW